ncbi:MAG: hypothetical protein L6R37_006275 [Teloschistes peruensis]|nr:MAG: hypothetical protein L6R37_006275 [Teloschistes peruensis]
MTIDRTFLASEDEGKLNWDANNNVMYSVVNKEAVNPYGEYRSYKIMPATGNRNHLTIQNSTTLGKSANWATHHLYAVQQKDTEPNSAYPYNGRDPNNPVVDFAKFFDGDSLDQEDIVITTKLTTFLFPPTNSYMNLGMHHIPDQSDLPNTVFTSAVSSMIIAPQNALVGDPSRSTIHQTRLNLVNGSVADALTFGSKQPTCSFDMGRTRPRLEEWTGEVYEVKYPYEPDAQMIANPGQGGLGGIP